MPAASLTSYNNIMMTDLDNLDCADLHNLDYADLHKKHQPEDMTRLIQLKRIYILSSSVISTGVYIGQKKACETI
jgi:hypothetical protein